MAISAGELVVQIRDSAAVKAEALREAADALYGNDGPDHPLSTATWLRERADRIERGNT